MDSELSNKLEAARAARAAKLAAREQDAETRAAQRELADLETIERLEEEHGAEGEGFAAVRGREITVFVKRPHHNTYAKFAEKAKTDFADLKQFVWPCIVAPDKADVDAALKVEPALLLRCANAVAALGGAAEVPREGK